jgi:hypothetical protein
MPPIILSLALALLTSASAAAQDPPEVIWEEDGMSAYYQMGWGVEWMDDVDWDEADDFVAAEPGAKKVHLYSGATREKLSSVAGGIRFGTSLAVLGDVDGDGFDDFAAGTPYSNGNTGELKVVSGLTAQTIYEITGSAGSEYFAHTMASAGDTDGDGVNDLLVYCRSGTGVVKLYSGVDGSFRYEIHGRLFSDYFGEAMAGIHDYDGDGYADFMIGAPDYPNGGLVTLYSGWNGAVLDTLSNINSANFGEAVAQLGDLNGDGTPELAVGAPETTRLGTSRVGELHVFSGTDLSLLRYRAGSSYLQKLGSHIANAGDYDGDGIADYLVSSPGSDAGGKSRAGKVELISGANSAVLGTATGWVSHGYFPTAIAGSGDGHRDNVPDALFGFGEGGSKLHGTVQIWGHASPWLQLDELVAGTTTTIRASNCQAGSRVQFWASPKGNGPTTLPQGTVLLSPPFRKLGYAITPIHGTAELSVDLPLLLSGHWVHAQGIEIMPGGALRLTTGLSAQVQ